MAAGSVYITAGLPVAKDSGQSPTGNGSAFITAGLPKAKEEAPAGGMPRPKVNCSLAHGRGRLVA